MFNVFDGIHVWLKMLVTIHDGKYMTDRVLQLIQKLESVSLPDHLLQGPVRPLGLTVLLHWSPCMFYFWLDLVRYLLFLGRYMERKERM